LIERHEAFPEIDAAATLATERAKRLPREAVGQRVGAGRMIAAA
jgi:hypothetical protein